MSDNREFKLQRIQQGSTPRVLDLFAGAGGLSLGFQRAGFEIVAAVENDPQAARTHAINHFKAVSPGKQEKHAQARDITEIEPNELLSDFGFEDTRNTVDVLVGGPPCQAYARIGRAKLREIAEHPEAYRVDPRGNLYLRFLHYVKELQPLVVMMENVPDALNYGGHNIGEETCEALSEMGYRCAYTLLNSAFYGVPQMRERMFLLAYTEELGVDPAFPAPTHWIELPRGYKSARLVALGSLGYNGRQPKLPNIYEEKNHFVEVQPFQAELPVAIGSRLAIQDLPPIYAPKLLAQGILKRGPQDVERTVGYREEMEMSEYAIEMRRWPLFETDDSVSAHVIRYLPRDYRIFARMHPGDEYPKAHRIAEELLNQALLNRGIDDTSIDEESDEYLTLRKEFVPPYDPGKFPNKWWKLDPEKPSRTLTAHIGKDTYTHIHYDSDQARTISVREAARLQSFPDGFAFSGKMNSSFRQIGNAVPPLLAFQLASEIRCALTFGN